MENQDHQKPTSHGNGDQWCRQAEPPQGWPSPPVACLPESRRRNGCRDETVFLYEKGNHDEAWYYLARDTESGAVYIEHEWAERGNLGSKRIEVAEFLSGPSMTARDNPAFSWDKFHEGAVGLAAIIASVYKRNWNAWHSAVVMNDKRDTQRQKVIRAGTISFEGSGIDCLVRNMSVGGANLEVESQIGIPSSFDLVINVEHSNHHCHVVWRKARRIGIAFD